MTVEREGRVFQAEGTGCAKAMKQEGARPIDKPEKPVGKVRGAGGNILTGKALAVTVGARKRPMKGF